MFSSAKFSQLAVLLSATLIAACATEQEPPPPAAAASGTATAGPDKRALAASLVKAVMIKPGDKVLISGSVRDAQLLEDAAIETMKAGGQPLISITSEKLGRRSFDEVPASYDTQQQTLGLAIAGLFDAQIDVEPTETENAMSGVASERIAARSKSGLPAAELFQKRKVRYVNVGNNLYPTDALAGRLGIPRSELSTTFWKAATVAPQTIRAKGDELRAAIGTGKVATITQANGTDITFAIDMKNSFISDGAVDAEKMKVNSSAASTWLPAGEFIIPAEVGTAEGKVVIDKMVYQGNEITGLTLNFSKGKLTSMSATAGLEPLQKRYDASGAGKDNFAFVDIGINPEAKFPVGKGWVVWMAPGAVTVGLGSNTGMGGTVSSDFGVSLQIAGATVKVDGKEIVSAGVLK